MNVPRIAYVRSGDLVYGYDGMKEARSAYELKSKQWQASIDTLQHDLQRAISEYNLQYAKLSVKERGEREALLKNQENNLGTYSQSMQEQAQKEDTKMTEGVLNQVNSFVETYAEEHGYDIVIGTTQSGNLLYGKNYMDITDELLKALNESYKGNSPGQPSQLEGK
jgi:outer membrane protein